MCAVPMQCIVQYVIQAHLHDDSPEGFHLLHAACCEGRALMRIEHDQVDLTFNILHQLHKSADTAVVTIINMLS